MYLEGKYYHGNEYRKKCMEIIDFSSNVFQYVFQYIFLFVYF